MGSPIYFDHSATTPLDPRLLQAMGPGCNAERARGLIRLSLGRFNTQQQVNRFLDVLSNAVAALPPVPERANFSRDATPAEVAFV